MKCANCQNEITDDSKFCPFCGEKTGIKPLSVAVVSPATESNENNTKKRERTGSKLSRWMICLLIIALLGGNIGELTIINNQKQDIDSLVSQLSSEQAKSAELNTDLSKTKVERDKYKTDYGYYSAIKQFMKSHGSEYKKDPSFHAYSNIIAVKKGQTEKLGVYYGGNRYIWVDYESPYIGVKWDDSKSSTPHLSITGKKAGVSELSFSLGNEKKSDDKIAFRVLVIVFDDAK